MQQPSFDLYVSHKYLDTTDKFLMNVDIHSSIIMCFNILRYIMHVKTLRT